MDLKNLKDLLTKSGNLNAAITRRNWFKDTDIFKRILNDTKCLDMFENISFSARFWFLYDDMEISYCKKCNKPYINFPKLQQSYRHCSHCQTFNVKSLNEKCKQAKDKLLNLIEQNLKNNKLVLNIEKFNELFDELSSKKENYQYLVSKKYIEIFSDIILKTKNLIEFDFKNLKLPERIYVLKHNLTEIPKCKFCKTNNCVFLNRLKGYSDRCSNHNCKSLKFKYISYNNHLDNSDNIKSLIDQNIDFSKYEVLQYPLYLTKNPLLLKCKKCGNVSEFYLLNGVINHLDQKMFYCKKCEDFTSTSEREFKTFILSQFDKKVDFNTRNVISPLELDIYIPEKKLAIEFDGLYWHSDMSGKNRNYHLNKTELCEKQNIQLIHIFENEWILKQDIVKSRIKNLLGIYDKTIYGRCCDIRQVNSKESKAFQDNNHIQGSVNSRINLGLFYDDELVSLMTFGKCRFNKKYEYELLRFCNKLNYHIPGAASKLLKYFEKTYNPKSLISYADRRWSKGNVYEKLGFKLTNISKPNYWYFRGGSLVLESRVKYQKHKIKDLLEKYDSSKSETENMKANGYNRIFDCGNLVYLKEYSNV